MPSDNTTRLFLSNETIKLQFSKHLKTLRIKRNLSQKLLAEKLGIPPSTYANWEQGRREPKIFDLFNIMYVLDIDYEEFFDIT